MQPPVAGDRAARGLRVLRVIRSTDPQTGGVVEGVELSTRALQRLGHTVEIASLTAPEAEHPDPEHVPVHRLGPGRGRYGFNRRLGAWLMGAVSGFDLVIVEGLWQYHAIAARRAALSHSVPYLVFTHGMLDPWFKRTYPFKHLKKWLYWPWADYRVLRDAAAVCFTTQAERSLARESFWLYRARETVVGYGTVAPPRVAPDLFVASRPELAGKRQLLFLSRIHPKKGCDLLLAAFAASLAHDPDWHLVMAGPDQVGWRGQLEAQARELGIAERVTWTGMLQGQEKWAAYAAADAFILPSHQENFGIVVAEALALGVPVLATHPVNTSELVAQSAAGLVDSDDLVGITRLLTRYAGLDAAARSAMRAQAQACFRTHFDVDNSARRLAEVMDDVIAKA